MGFDEEAEEIMEQKLFLLLICVYGICCPDPCTNHRPLNEETRAVDHSLGLSETESCDRLISEDWYVLQDNGTIPTECPPLLRCGSTGPIWMNGSLPDANNEVSLPVCQVGFVGCCESTWQIRVRHCGSFYVFHLTATPACPGRYCIEGPPAPCQPGWGSENGLEPCSPINITFAVTPQVLPYVPDISELAFECKVNMPIVYRSYVFDIQWSIDNKVVAVKKNIQYSSIKVQGTLHRKDWDPKLAKTLGIRVACAMRARAFSGKPPTEYSSSSEFFAGVTVESTSLNVQSNSVALIKIKSTVPVVCRTIGGHVFCDIRMELFSYRDQFKDQEQRHCNQSLTEDIKPSACGLEFDGQKWNQYQTISVSALTDPTSRPSYSAIVKLKAISSRDTLWRDYFLPDITVNVAGIQRPTGHCRSYTDPHISTVDGRRFLSLALGEFVLYKVKNTPVEVHTIQTTGGRYDGINCAVAVRAASDVFVVYGCGSTNKWIVRRLNCNEQNQHLKVFERSLGKIFEIILPSGTRVNIEIRYNRWLNIDIYPSFTDWNQTEGICGTYNGNGNDDLTDRNGQVVGKADFIKSWSVTQTESLFVAKIRNEILSVPFFYCSCIKDAFPPGQVTEKADCAWEDSLPICQPLNWGQKKCQLLGKREAVDDIEIDVPEDMIVFEESTSSTDWKNGWNESFARQRCESALHKSPVFKECTSLQNVHSDQTIEACIDDIRISGSDLFMNDVRERMKAECLSELRFNASLWNNNTETSEPSLIDAVFDNDCPNDCSSAGTCIKGECVCQPSYTGEDCSINTDRPPTLYDASEESLCDLSKRPCTSTSVFGEGFYASGSIRCKISQATIIGSTIKEGNVTKIETGNLESFAEVKCPIAGIIDRRKRSITNVSDPDVVLVSVSMDGSTFSSSVPVVMFNSSCSSCVISGNTVACDIRSDICIRNGECFEITNENCASSNIAPVENVYPTISLIIGIVVGSVCLLAIVVLVVVKMYKHKRRFVKNIDEPNFTMALAQESGSAPVSHKFK